MPPRSTWRHTLSERLGDLWYLFSFIGKSKLAPFEVSGDEVGTCTVPCLKNETERECAERAQEFREKTLASKCTQLTNWRLVCAAELRLGEPFVSARVDGDSLTAPCFSANFRLGELSEPCARQE